jgi:hypothetical protein
VISSDIDSPTFKETFASPYAVFGIWNVDTLDERASRPLPVSQGRATGTRQRSGILRFAQNDTKNNLSDSRAGCAKFRYIKYAYISNWLK